MRASQVLSHLANQPDERLSVSAILAILSDHSFAVLILLLGLPNCVPMPPPIPTVCALLLILIALQIGFGRKSPWLPAYVLRRSIGKAEVERAVGRALPLVSSLERWSRPRLLLFESNIAAGLTGLVLAALALGLLTAAPLLGQIPFGVAVTLLGLGLIERDGALIAGGVVAGALGALVSAGFVYALLVALRNLV